MGHFRLEVADGVANATLDRPPANALDYGLYDELSLLLEEFESDDAVRVVVFASANERIFMAGANLQDMEHYDRRRGASARKVDTVQSTFVRLQRLGKPTIGVLAGHALGGGCEFSLCLDFRFMARGKARIGLPEATLGFVPGGGGTQRLARLVGRAQATRMLMLGERLDADEAERVGLVTEACDDAAATNDRAMQLATQLAERPPVALRLIKRALNDGVDGDLPAGLAVEREAVIEALATEDALEGPRAFLEKRAPQFKGR
jgi:enoyl-CoA hydratase